MSIGTGSDKTSMSFNIDSIEIKNDGDHLFVVFMQDKQVVYWKKTELLDMPGKTLTIQGLNATLEVCLEDPA